MSHPVIAETAKIIVFKDQWLIQQEKAIAKTKT